MRIQVETEFRYTQAAMVKSESLAVTFVGRITDWLLPLRLTALLLWPVVQVAPPISVPVQPFPVASDALVPLVSLNLKYASCNGRRMVLASEELALSPVGDSAETA